MINMVGLRGPIMIGDGIRDNTCSGLLDHTMHLKSFAILVKIDSKWICLCKTLKTTTKAKSRLNVRRHPHIFS